MAARRVQTPRARSALSYTGSFGYIAHMVMQRLRHCCRAGATARRGARRDRVGVSPIRLRSADFVDFGGRGATETADGRGPDFVDFGADAAGPGPGRQRRSIDRRAPACQRTPTRLKGAIVLPGGLVLSVPSRTLAVTNGLLLAFAAAPALAQDVSIGTQRTDPIATATAGTNGTPANVTVTSTGSIATTGASVATINSANSLTNGGTLSSSATSNVVGVAIGTGSGLGGFTFTNNGAVNITGSGGSGNTGILISGGAASGTIASGLSGSITVAGDNGRGVAVTTPFTGDISLRSVVVNGSNSIAVQLAAPVTGNVTLLGSSGAIGAGGIGVNLVAPVTGRLRIGGTIAVGGSQSFDASGNVVNGNIANVGLRISADLGGGILNDRYFIDSSGNIVSADTANAILVTGGVGSTGTAPALWIAPAAAAAGGTPAPVTIAAGSSGYGLENLGSFSTTTGNNGLAVTAVRIGGGGATTTIGGGIVQRSTGTIAASSTNAAATALRLDAGALVPRLDNAGTIATLTSATSAVGSTAAGAGGNAIAVDIAAGASLSSLTNAGTISATANGAGTTATAVIDRSGTLTSLTNSGTISANAPTGNTVTAIDLAAGTAATTVTNTGAITGAVRFGSGFTTLTTSGTAAVAGSGGISGPIAFGSGGGTFGLAGTAAYAGTLTSGGGLSVSLANTARLDLSNGPASLSGITASGASVLVLPTRGSAPSLTVTGTATFTGTSVVRVSLQSLAPAQNVTVLQADGGIVTDHPATLLDPNVSPFLFTASTPVLTGNTLSLTLTRRTAADLGLSPGQASLYNAALASLTDNSAEATAIANLPNREAVVAAFRQITPASAGSYALRAAQSFADMGYGATQQRLAALADTRRRGPDNDFGVWIQQLGDFTRTRAGSEYLGNSSAAYGVGIGADMPVLGLDAAGIAIISTWTTVRQDLGTGLPASRIIISEQGLTPYLQWSTGNDRRRLYVQASGLIAKLIYTNDRAVAIGSYSSTISSRWTGLQYGGGATIGGQFRFGKLELLPSDTIYWTQLQQNGFTESGGGAFNLEVAKRNDSVLSNTARLALGWHTRFGDGDIIAQAHASYTSNLQVTAAPTVAKFVTANEAITLPQEYRSRDLFGYGGNVGYLQRDLRLTLDYDRRENSSYKDQQVSLSASLAF